MVRQAHTYLAGAVSGTALIVAAVIAFRPARLGPGLQGVAGRRAGVRRRRERSRSPRAGPVGGGEPPPHARRGRDGDGTTPRAAGSERRGGRPGAGTGRRPRAAPRRPGGPSAAGSSSRPRTPPAIGRRCSAPALGRRSASPCEPLSPAPVTPGGGVGIAANSAASGWLRARRCTGAAPAQSPARRPQRATVGNTVSQSQRSAWRGAERHRRHRTSPKASSTASPAPNRQPATRSTKRRRGRRLAPCPPLIGIAPQPSQCPSYGGARTVWRGRGDPIAGSPVYPAGSRVNERGHLEVGGCDVVELAAELGTPAYLYAEDDMRARARAYREAFERAHRRLRGPLRQQVACPAPPPTGSSPRRGSRSTSPPAASSTSPCAPGFDPARIHMHGNNKTDEEILLAARAGVGHLILDSFDEIERCERLLDAAARRC